MQISRNISHVVCRERMPSASLSVSDSPTRSGLLSLLLSALLFLASTMAYQRLALEDFSKLGSSLTGQPPSDPRPLRRCRT